MMVQGKIPKKDPEMTLQYANSFEESRVNSDLLLQLSEDLSSKDIEMPNGIFLG